MKKDKILEKTQNITEIESCLEILNNLSMKSKKWFRQSKNLIRDIDQHINNAQRKKISYCLIRILKN